VPLLGSSLRHSRTIRVRSSEPRCRCVAPVSREWLNGAILDTSHKMSFCDTDIACSKQVRLPLLAHRDISRRRSNSVAFGAKGTLSRIL
jgi:hypothetical protein